MIGFRVHCSLSLSLSGPAVSPQASSNSSSFSPCASLPFLAISDTTLAFRTHPGYSRLPWQTFHTPTQLRSWENTPSSKTLLREHSARSRVCSPAPVHLRRSPNILCTVALHTVTGHKVAMKFISKQVINATKTKSRVQREVEYMRTLRHAHIIKLYVLFHRLSCFMI